MKTPLNFGGRRGGFTLIEIMTVIAIIGLLAAVAIPNFVKARNNAQTKTCIRNLQEIDGAKEQWAIETKQTTGATVGATEITQIDSYIKGGEPKCPASGTYVFNNIGVNPTCTITGHSL